ncbi:MAG: uncharacterized protein H6R26_1834, partial [Proteobacteria bacterium]|nr:uncharacterized protein [Pseudomonadota bacterium]
SALVYGSGIDTRPELVEKLSQGRVCFGNSPQTLRLINDPAAFFELLARLNIPYPETRFAAPEAPAGWLIKRGCSEGGKGVRLLAKNRPAGPGEYYQRRLPGHPLSALFLANGHDIRIIGFNTLWVSDCCPERPFEFSGAINWTSLDAAQRAKVAAYALDLTRAAGLVGLNSLDFMVGGADIRVLELNPRPSASMTLYDADYRNGLLAAHIAACRGSLSMGGAQSGPVRAFAIVRARCTVRIDSPVAWPDWCADRPCRGSVIEAGEPLSSVRAEAQDRHATEALLRDRTAQILARFEKPQGRASQAAP